MAGTSSFSTGLSPALANTAEDLAVVSGSDDLRSRWGALSNRAMACLEAGDIGVSERADDAAAAIAGTLGLPGARWRTQFVKARRLTWHGDLASARRQARSALETGEAPGEDAAYLHRGQLHLIWWTEGRLPEVGGALDSMALDRPLDVNLDFALWLTARDLAPRWLPALQAGQLDLGGDARKLAFALEAVGSPGVVGPLVDLVRSGRVPPDREESVLALIATLGGPNELAAVFELVLSPDALPVARRASLLAALAVIALTERANARVVPAIANGK